MPKTRRRRRTYTLDRRTSILEVAQKQGLTAAQVQRKFGVTPVTYYSWRKKYLHAGRGASPTVRGTDLTRQLRTTVQARVRTILPGIVRNEVNQYLNTLFGGGRGRTRKT